MLGHLACSERSICALDRYDVVLVGAGIMSSTLATLLHELDPDLRLLCIERLEAPALESTAAVNNAGTGHAANCELNYTLFRLMALSQQRSRSPSMQVLSAALSFGLRFVNGGV